MASRPAALVQRAESRQDRRRGRWHHQRFAEGLRQRDYSGAFDTFDLTVGTGSAPTFTTSATLPPATEDAAYTTTITASDNDGNVPLVFAAVDPLPTWLELVAATGTTATLRSDDAAAVQGNVGNHSIAIRVTDSGGLSTTQTFTLAVTNVNDKPSVTTTTLPNGTQGQAYSTTVDG